MLSSLVDKKVEQLVKNYGTRDPIKIANKIGIIILYEELGEIHGYYNKHRRIKFIHVNVNSTEKEMLYIYWPMSWGMPFAIQKKTHRSFRRNQSHQN